MTGHILIAADVPTHRIILKTRLTEAAYAVSLARSEQDLGDRLRTERPDVLLLASGFCADPLGFLSDYRAGPRGLELPILYLSADMSEGARVAALQAGADMVMDALPETPLLRARLRNLMRRVAREAELGQGAATAALLGFSEAMPDGFKQPGQVAVIAPSLADGLTWRNGLTQRMRDHISVLDPATALQDLAQMPPPDAFVIGEPDGTPEAALQFISDLYSRPKTLHAAVVLAQQAPSDSRAIAAFDMGVSDVVSGEFFADEVSALLRREMARKARDDNRRAELQDGLRLAHTDPLTGLFNRRYAMRHLNHVMRQADAGGTTYAVMVLDLDRFKTVNDRFGHAAGDAVLKDVTQRISACMRRGDFVARIGGEEFLAVIRNCDLAAARTAAERIRSCVSAAPIPLPDGETLIDITTSIGIVIGGPGAATGSASELIDLADRGLYTAKAEGRNQVTVYPAAA